MPGLNATRSHRDRHLAPSASRSRDTTRGSTTSPTALTSYSPTSWTLRPHMRTSAEAGHRRRLSQPAVGWPVLSRVVVIVSARPTPQRRHSTACPPSRPIHGAELFALARRITPHVAYFLHRNTDVREVGALVRRSAGWREQRRGRGGVDGHQAQSADVLLWRTRGGPGASLHVGTCTDGVVARVFADISLYSFLLHGGFWVTVPHTMRGNTANASLFKASLCLRPLPTIRWSLVLLFISMKIRLDMFHLLPWERLIVVRRRAKHGSIVRPRGRCKARRQRAGSNIHLTSDSPHTFSQGSAYVSR